jgi:hypothetical protein
MNLGQVRAACNYRSRDIEAATLDLGLHVRWLEHIASLSAKLLQAHPARTNASLWATETHRGPGQSQGSMSLLWDNGSALRRHEKRDAKGLAIAREVHLRLAGRRA